MTAIGAPEVATICQQLSRFSCLQVAPALSEQEQADLKSQLQTLEDWAEYETLGICADSLDQAKTAMEAYLAALGISVSLQLPERQGAVYLKFNTLKGAWYLDDYTGPSRGVLVSFHGADIDDVNRTFGPFPLDLFQS